MTFTWHCWQDYAHADLVMMELSIMYQSVPVSGSWPSSNPLVTWNQLHFAVLSYSLNIYLQCPVTAISKYFSPTMVIAHCSWILSPNSGVATTYKMPDSTLCFAPRTSVHGVGDSAHMVMPHSALLYCSFYTWNACNFQSYFRDSWSCLNQTLFLVNILWTGGKWKLLHYHKIQVRLKLIELWMATSNC